MHDCSGGRDRRTGRARSGIHCHARHLRPSRGGDGMTPWTRDQMAARVARDIPEGAYVNLGIGLPTLAANHLPRDKEILLHSEDRLLGLEPAPAAGQEEPDLT